MPFIIGIVVLVILAVLWYVSSQRKLVALDENINNAMSQIGVQLSSRWDAVTALVDLAREYSKVEYDTLMDTVAQRKSITAASSASEANEQDQILTNAVSRIVAVAESYPELKSSENYIKAMDSVTHYEDMVRQSRMIYNDSVTKLNRAVRQFPTSIIAGALGFGQRAYLEADSSKADMPSFK